MADQARCPECLAYYGRHHPTCCHLLETAKHYDDTDEERRLVVALERANSGAAEYLILRGIDPHTYRAGSRA